MAEHKKTTTRAKSTKSRSGAKRRASKTTRKTVAPKTAVSRKKQSLKQKGVKKSRRFLFFSLGSVLGIAAGFVLGIFVFPYIFPPDPAKEVVHASEKKGLHSVGKFIHANPRDPVHFGAGSVTVYKNLVHLGSDFKVGPGPAFHVYLSPRAKIRSSKDFSETAALDLGKLRSFEGSQKYTIPAGTDLSQYKSVLIWCRKFSVLISPADLNKVSMVPEKKEQ